MDLTKYKRLMMEASELEKTGARARLNGRPDIADQYHRQAQETYDKAFHLFEDDEREN